MSDFNPDSIVDELIELEPSLSEFRADLIKSIRAIVAAKPDTKFSDQFKAKLLRELRAKFLPESSSSLSLIERMNKFIYALGGAAVASLVIYITVINPMIPMPSDGDRDSMQGPEVTEELSDEAFGNLASTDPSISARPQSAGGGRAGGGGGGIAPMMDMAVSEGKMIAPGEPYPGEITATEYVYDGDVKLPEGTVTVMRRLQPKGSAKADLLDGTFVSDLMNVGELGSLSVINVTLSESGPEPLNVYVDFNDGSLNVNRQIDYRTYPGNNCTDEACYQRYRLKESDMPTDASVIETAQKFMKDLGVDTAQYGEPVIRYNWREMRSMQPEGDFYYPESIEVAFPYLVGGLPVYDSWGFVSGPSVSVDVRLRAATGMWGLRLMNMESSEYAAIDDAKAFMEVVRRGGADAYFPDGATLQQATLGDPKQVYMTHYKWDEAKNMGYELFVPALAFPVTKQANEYENRVAVVVPLTADLLEIQGGVLPRPMPVEPLMEGEVKGMPVPGSSVDEMEVYPDGAMQRPMEDGIED